jgi:hypothetical protein
METRRTVDRGRQSILCLAWLASRWRLEKHWGPTTLTLQANPWPDGVMILPATSKDRYLSVDRQISSWIFMWLAEFKKTTGGITLIVI